MYDVTSRLTGNCNAHITQYLKLASGVKKTEVFKKVEILQVLLVLEVVSWKKRYFYYRGKKLYFFPCFPRQL